MEVKTGSIRTLVIQAANSSGFATVADRQINCTSFGQ
jgi:hypothetical protein